MSSHIASATLPSSSKPTPIPETATSHPDDPIPQEPCQIPQHNISIDTDVNASASESSLTSDSSSFSDSDGPSTPQTTRQIDKALEEIKVEGTGALAPTALQKPRGRRGSTKLISSNPQDVRRILGSEKGTQYVGKVCCGGGCCFLKEDDDPEAPPLEPVNPPDNEAYRSLLINLGRLSLQSKLTNIADLLEQTVFLSSMTKAEQSSGLDSQYVSTVSTHPPEFVKPHPPYDVFSAKLRHARALTKPGAEKRTYHFDLDVTDYPSEGGNVDFVVGGAIGVCAPNSSEVVDEILDLLCVPRSIRDSPVRLRTTTGRWPTIWGDEMARELVTTRRELLTWCSDVQSYPPTKPLLRMLAEYASDASEKQILRYLCSAQGQAAFCDLRTGPHLTLSQLLSAFPSARPPLDLLLGVLNTLMPRFYSLSQDPEVSLDEADRKKHRVIEIAVTVHETPNWRGGPRTGVGSGFFERQARKIEEAEARGEDVASLDLRIPMFRGLMANPLAKEFVSDGPMLLIGAGVGVAPFRGFVQRRLKNANCANKVWVLQGVRDSLVDELYSGEWGVEEERVKKVVQSRRGKGRYVQEEVRLQADLVWFIVNAIDGRIFVCGSSKGMGEGVENALIDVSMQKGNLNRDEAIEFWKRKKEEGQYIAETW